MRFSDLYKLAAVLFLLAISAEILHIWYGAFILGSYYMSAGPFMLIGGALVPLVVILVVSLVFVQIAKTYFPNKGE